MLEEYQLKIIKQDRYYIYYATTNDDYNGVLRINKFKKERFINNIKDGITPYQWELLIEECEEEINER